VTLLGAIGGQPAADILWFGLYSEPFPDTEAFYEFVMRRPASERQKAHEEYGHPHLPYDSPIVFTHSDLNFHNILITPRDRWTSERPHVMAIIDWDQSGWMPSFWEYGKVKYRMIMSDPEEIGDMMERLPEIFEGDVPSDEVFMAFATYIQFHGGLMG
jgi:hypothetical protein